MKVYGIPNCNTVKKALNFLDENEIEYEFINFKKSPPTKSFLKAYKKQYKEWPANKRGPTFRKIKEDYEESPSEKQADLLIEFSSAIKRPIVDTGKKYLTAGFDQEEWEKELL